MPNIKRLTIILLFLFIPVPLHLHPNLSKDYLLLNGEEQLISYGMDTTYNWWAITSPYDRQFKLYINGEDDGAFTKIAGLTFSPDGQNWAYFAYDNVQLYLITPDTIMLLIGNKHGEILFSSDSKVMVFSYYLNNEEFIHHNDKVIRTMYRTGKLFLSPNGANLGFYLKRLGKYYLNVNGIEINSFDSLIIFGFWHTGELIYAGGTNQYMELYKGKKAISKSYVSIRSPLINRNGTVAAFIGTDFSGESYVVLISDDYYEPIVSKRYDIIESIALHPDEPIIAAKVKDFVNYFILYNTIEFYAGRSVSEPLFTYDGSEMYYIYCELSCFLVKNGKKYRLDNINIFNRTIAVKPNSLTYSYTTNSSLIMGYLDSSELIAGMMVDETSQPRYNWRTGKYEALGRINNRLYLLTITPDA